MRARDWTKSSRNREADDERKAAEGGELVRLNAYVDRAVEDGAWAMRELHGVADNSWEDVTDPEQYFAHLDYVKSLVDSGDLWMDTPTEVLKYRFARDRCGAPLASGNDVAFDDTANEECQKHATVVSVVINVPEYSDAVDSQPVPNATQAGVPLETRSLGFGRYHVNMNPVDGPATLSLE